MPNRDGDLTVHDLPMREQLKAYLPATSAILGMISILGLVLVLYVSNQRDADQKQREKIAAGILRISTARFSYATNRSVCGFRQIADDAIAANRQVIARSTAALRDPDASAGAKARNQKAKRDAEAAIVKAQAFKLTQITVPFDYDCAKLPTTPPPETRAPAD